MIKSGQFLKVSVIALTIPVNSFADNPSTNCIAELLVENTKGKITCDNGDKDIVRGFKDGSSVDFYALEKIYKHNPGLFKTSKMKSVLEEALLLSPDKALNALGETPLIVPMCSPNEEKSYELNIASMQERYSAISWINEQCESNTKQMQCSHKLINSIKFCTLILDYYLNQNNEPAQLDQPRQ